MYYNVESINLKSKYETKEVCKFLEKFSLKYEDVDYTVESLRNVLLMKCLTVWQ